MSWTLQKAERHLPSSREQAIQGCSLDPSLGYCAAKKLSERAAWDFMQTQRPSFDLVTLAAPMIFGPTRQKLSSIKDISFSLTLLWSILGAQKLPESYSSEFILSEREGKVRERNVAEYVDQHLSISET